MDRLQNEKAMKCIVCHGQDVRLADVREQLKIGQDIVYVPIQTLVCQACGEAYYDRRTIRFLEEAAAKLRQNRDNLEEIGKVLLYK